MMVPTDLALGFLASYKEMLARFIGQPLNNSMDFLKARNAFYASSARQDPPTSDENLLHALTSAVYGRFIIGRHLAKCTELIGSTLR